MPSTSPISGWAIPLDSDPLANAALAVRNLVDSIEAGWTAYTPAWTATTTNPAIGNGTIIGRYKRIGKTVHYRIHVLAGTTTTYGTGNYAFTVPFAAHALGALQLLNIGEASIAGAAYPVRGRLSPSGTSVLLYTPNTVAGGGDRAVTPTVPATFANASGLQLEGTYEAA